MKRPSRQYIDRRWLAGAIILLAIAVILGNKLLGSDPNTVIAQPIPGPTPGTSMLGVENADPWPADPVGQLDWVVRYEVPVMVLFRSTDCIPCKVMDELTQSVWDDYKDDIALVTVITNDRANLPLIQQAGVQTIPTSFFIDRTGQGKRFVGAMQEEALRAELVILQED